MSKASNLRSCPALAQEITAVDCGEKRNSEIPCPGACPFNPLSIPNYNLLLQIEEKVDRATQDIFGPEVIRDRSLIAEMRNATETNDIFSLNFLVVRTLFAKRANGKSLVQSFVDSGMPGFKNDQRVMMRGKLELRIALLQPSATVSPSASRAFDLLRPEVGELILADRSFSQFFKNQKGVLLAAIYPLPGFYRIHGAAYALPELGNRDPADFTNHAIDCLGGPSDKSARTDWLLTHVLEVVSWIQKHSPVDLPDSENSPMEQTFAAALAAEDQFPAADPTLPPAPSLPAEPLSTEDCLRRLNKIRETLPDVDAMLNESHRCGGLLESDLDAVLGKILTEEEQDFALFIVLKACFVLCPPGFKWPTINFNVFVEKMNVHLRSFSVLASPPNLASQSRQPMVFTLISSVLIQAIEHREVKIRVPSAVLTVLFLSEYIDELDRQLRVP